MMPTTYVNGRGEQICTRCGQLGPHRRCKSTKDSEKRSNLSQQELEEAAQGFAQKFWNRTFTGEIVLAEKLPFGILGMYLPDEQIIVLSEKKNAKRDKETVQQYLLHELVHWHMHTSGLPSKDGDQEFVAECLRVGAPVSGAEHAQDALKEIEIAERMELFGIGG